MQPYQPRGQAMHGLPALRERGWTPTLVARFLGAPDALRPNPVYKSAAPSRLYDAARVEAAEALPEFAVARAAPAKRSVSASLSAQLKAARLVQQARETPIVVRKIGDLVELMRLAIASYNDHQAEREMRAWERGQEWYDMGETATERSDPAFLERITVNYIRHTLTTYDRHLESVAGKVGVREAVAVMRDRVYGAVADTYPQYRAECNRQLERRKEQDA